MSCLSSFCLSPQADWVWDPSLLCQELDGSWSEDVTHQQFLCGLLHHGRDYSGILSGHVPSGWVPWAKRGAAALHDTHRSGVTSATRPSQLWVRTLNCLNLRAVYRAPFSDLHRASQQLLVPTLAGKWQLQGTRKKIAVLVWFKDHKVLIITKKGKCL